MVASLTVAGADGLVQIGASLAISGANGVARIGACVVKRFRLEP